MKKFLPEQVENYNLIGKNTISSIKISDQNDLNFSIICTSNIYFFRGDKSLITSKIISRKNIFLSGNFRPNCGKIFGLCGRDNRIDLINMEKKKILRSWNAHKNSINDVCFSDNKTNLLSGSVDETLKLWDLSLQKCISSFCNQKKVVSSVAFFPGHKTIGVTSSPDGKIRFFDLRLKNAVMSIFDHECPVEKFKFAHNGNYLISAGGNNLKIWNSRANKEIYVIKEKKSISSFDLLEENCFIYTTLYGEMKKVDIFKRRLYAIYCFRTAPLFVASKSGILIVAFSKGKICLKRFCINNLFSNKKNNGRFQFEKKKTKNNHTDACSSLYYFMAKKTEKYMKRKQDVQIFNELRKSEKKKKSTHHASVNQSVRVLTSSRMFATLGQIGITVNNPSLMYIYASILSRKKILEKVIFHSKNNFLQFLSNLLISNFQLFPITDFIFVFKDLLKIIVNLFGRSMKFSNTKIFFIFFEKNKSMLKKQNSLDSYVDLIEFI